MAYAQVAVERVGERDALTVFHGLAAESGFPTLDPRFVIADAARDRRAEPYFVVAHSAAGTALRSGHLTDTPVDGLQVRDLSSPYGFGGVAHDLSSKTDLRRFGEKFREFLAEQGVVVEFARIHPRLHDQEHFFEHMADNRAVVEIDLLKQLLPGYRPRLRTTIRREIERGLLVTDGGDPRAFAALYRQTMTQLDAHRFYFFSDDYFDALGRLPGATFWEVRDGFALRAGLLTLASQPSGSVDYLLGARDTAVSGSLLAVGIHGVASLLQDRGFSTFMLGGGRSTDPDDGLLRFKRGFSRVTAMFRIGWNILDSDAYRTLAGMSSPWSPDERIIFYRD